MERKRHHYRKKRHRNFSHQRKQKGLVTKVLSFTLLSFLYYIKSNIVGVPCWLVDSSHEMAECPIAERIVAYLQQTPELREAQEEIRNSSMPKFEESTILLSILQKPKKNREKNKSDIFNLNDVVVSPRRVFMVNYKFIHTLCKQKFIGTFLLKFSLHRRLLFPILTTYQ